MAGAGGERRRRLTARVGALVLDTLLVAYAAWCVDFVIGHGVDAPGFLARWPGLLALAPLVATLWQVGGGSLGQRGYRLGFEAHGARPDLDARALWGLAATGQAVLVLAPFAVLGPTPLALGLAALLAALLGALALRAGHGRSLPERAAELALAPRRGVEAQDVAPWPRRANPWIVLLLLGLTFTVGALVTEFEAGRLLEGAGRTEALWGRLFRPDWSITDRVVERMVETVFLALMASTLALPFAFLLSFFGARNLMAGSALGRVLYALVRVLMNVARSIEPLVWAIIFVLWVGVGPFAGMLALLVHSIAALGKLYSEAIESIDEGPVEAIRATGAGFLQVLRYGVVPQVVPPFLSFTVYRWDINVRMATVLGLVGGGGIGDLLINYQQLAAWSKVGTIIVFITLVVWLMDIASSKARERLG